MTLTPLLEAPTIIVVHAVSAVMALLLGAAQLFRKKGDPVHRFIGASWVALMLMVSLSSFLIWTIRVWWLFSPIHLISIFTLVMLWRGSASHGGATSRHTVGPWSISISWHWW